MNTPAQPLSELQAPQAFSLEPPAAVAPVAIESASGKVRLKPEDVAELDTQVRQFIDEFFGIANRRQDNQVSSFGIGRSDSRNAQRARRTPGAVDRGTASGMQSREDFGETRGGCDQRRQFSKRRWCLSS